MKKLLFILLACVLATLLIGTAYAEALEPVDPAAGFVSWEILGTFGGALAATVAIVQLIKKPIDTLIKIPTNYLVYIVALMLLIAAQAFVPGLGGFAPSRIVLCLVNAVYVSLAAMKSFDLLSELKKT